MTRTELPTWANEVLASCPIAGNGVHHWLFVAALKLHRYCPDKDELERLLAEATTNCGREVTASELANAVRDSQRVIEDPDRQTRRAPRWPGRDEGRIESIVCNGPNFAQLADLSPVKWKDDVRHTEEILDALFPGDPLLCAAPSLNRPLTRTREKWRGFLEKQQLIVPSPMSAIYGITKDGEKSMRTLGNTGQRRFLVIESDTGTFDQQSAVLLHLKKFAPLVTVVHSGGKSLHGWFLCAGEPESAVDKLFRYAVSLGADPKTWTTCQWVRMPDGQRDNGNRQQVIYFNPEGLDDKI